MQSVFQVSFVNQSVRQSAIRSVSQSVSQCVGHSVCRLISQSFIQTVSKSVSQCVGHSVCWLVSQSFTQSVTKSVCRSSSLSGGQSVVRKQILKQYRVKLRSVMLELNLPLHVRCENIGFRQYYVNA